MIGAGPFVFPRKAALFNPVSLQSTPMTFDRVLPRGGGVTVSLAKGESGIIVFDRTVVCRVSEAELLTRMWAYADREVEGLRYVAKVDGEVLFEGPLPDRDMSDELKRPLSLFHALDVTDEKNPLGLFLGNGSIMQVSIKKETGPAVDDLKVTYGASVALYR